MRPLAHWAVLSALLALHGPARADPISPFEGLHNGTATTPRADEPAIASLRLDAEGYRYIKSPWYRLELAFGWTSLLEDPDVAEGYGGGIYFTLGFHRYLGVELSFFFGNNPFEDEIGTIQGSEFMAGNICLGPVFRLPLPWDRVTATVELGFGPYGIKDQLRQTLIWTLGVNGGATLAVHVWRWVSVGIKMRYHLFNLTTIAGDDLMDIKAFREVGVIDRFELPLFVGAYF